MDDRTQQLLLMMTDEDKLNLARFTSAQIMELASKFREARDKLALIEGVPPSLLSQMDSVIQSIDDACTQSSQAELELLQTTTKYTPLN